MRIRSFIALAAALAAVALAATARADLLFNVHLDTSLLVGHPAGPFALDFQLSDGAGTGDGNNTVVLANFLFGSGAATGAPSLLGGASGSLASGVTLTDSAFLSEFTQGFTPGAFLSFDVQMSTNVDAGPTPDQFSFALLDNTDAEVPTFGPGDAFVLVNLNAANPAVAAYAGNVARTPAGGGSGLGLPAPTITVRQTPEVIPEPTTLALVAAGLLPFAGAVRRRAPGAGS